jgi:hypothetical protein
MSTLFTPVRKYRVLVPHDAGICAPLRNSRLFGAAHSAREYGGVNQLSKRFTQTPIFFL